jgi:SAM-dependent methyltransferase
LPKPFVTAINISKGLPFKNDSFDASYSSHILEHFDLKVGELFISEQLRVLKTGGVIRVVVPDLVSICRNYLKEVDELNEDSLHDDFRNLNWMKLELLDQMTRSVSGGQMRKTLNSQDFNFDFVSNRIGDVILRGKSPPVVLTSNRSDVPGVRFKDSFKNKIHRRWIKTLLKLNPKAKDPRSTGEVHRWMYDRFALKELLEKSGFRDIRVCRFNESRIPDWDKQNLDISLYGDFPRKPDSLFMEGIKN